ncbi:MULTISPECIES: class I SAM-dependent methyltransferase [Tsukamurella]|uniref:Class I SAM-dependent methyltransferase n=1 Tax=Tsukamurella strandjordii TaxID=147577 RepID=A0AA90NPH1_9ACTN|nr:MULTISPECIES: class I SAM-dependent methyltransferase [Tsukamurella]MDP0398314.1 class I SAM-dependent methyltransferase [Tsukamurella strandjordii]GIZ97850.1 similarity with UbiE/COQ5 methyltransferase [Tsukamurella sp. TY48]
MNAGALDRVESMLDRSRLHHEPQRVHGYLDVLGPGVERPAGLSHMLMNAPAVAAVYEKAWRPAFTRLFSLGGTGTLSRQDVLLDDLASGGDRRILDVACGPGLYTRPLGRRLSGDGIAVGLDVSEPMLRRAVRDNSADRVAYVRGSALDLPFADGTFDTVVCLAALYLIPAPRLAVREIARVTAPGGRVALFTSLQTPLTSVFGASAERATGFRWFGRDEITGWLREDGLTDVQQTLSGQGQFVTGIAPAEPAQSG